MRHFGEEILLYFFSVLVLARTNAFPESPKNVPRTLSYAHLVATGLARLTE